MDAPIAQSPPPELFTLAVDAWTQPFWDAARAHQLTACKCGSCGQFRMPPTPFCPNCQSQAVEWPKLSGHGRIYSFTIVERAILPDMEAHLPYVPAVVTLPDAGDVRLVSNIVGCPVSAVAIDAAVEAVWEDREDGVSVVRFVLSGRGRDE